MAMASISHGGKVFRFRTNPNSIRWTYTLNTKVDETYGGRVVQILSASIDDLVVTADAGGGGWEYLYAAAIFFRDMLFDQRSGGEPGTFSYPNRGWEMDVYAVNFPFKDGWNEVRREFTMQFKVQEDVSGVVTSDTVTAEIERLKKGIEYEHNDFNTPPGDVGSSEWPVFSPDVNAPPDVPPVDPAAPKPTTPSTPSLPGGSTGNNGPWMPTPTPSIPPEQGPGIPR